MYLRIMAFCSAHAHVFFQESIDSAEKKLDKSRVDNTCKGLDQEVIKCFSSNPGKSLNCAKICQQYKECADENRARHLQRQAA